MRWFFCAIVMLSNTLSIKMVRLGNLKIPAGLFLYPLTFFLNNLVSLRKGAKRARRMVYTAFGFVLISLMLPLPLMRMRSLASLVAFGAAQLTDIALFGRWNQKRLWLRSNGSTWIS